MWNQWKVDLTLMVEFSKYLKRLAQKWNMTELAAAMEHERQAHPNNPAVKKNIDFFVEVFVKANFLKTKYGHDLEKCLNFVRDKYHMNNSVFLRWILTEPPTLLKPPPRQPVAIAPKPPPTVVNLTSDNQIQKRPAAGQEAEPLSIQSVLSVNNNPESVDNEITIKSEPLAAYSESISYGASVRVIDSVMSDMTGSVIPTSVGDRGMGTADGTVKLNKTKIGRGSKCIQFFFECPEDGTEVSSCCCSPLKKLKIQITS